MRKLLEKIQDDLTGFVQQEQDQLMVLSCADPDLPAVLLILRGVEQQDDDSLFLLVADPFEGTEQFVEVCLERLRAEHCLADDALTREGEPGLAALPEEVFDESRPPVERLWRALEHLRSLLPEQPSSRTVVALAPSSIADERAFLDLPGRLLRGRSLAGMRLIVRIGARAPADRPALARGPRTRFYPVRIDQRAIEESLDEEAADPRLPTEQRMQAVLQLATLDVAFGRHPEAIEKYNLLLGHYQSTNDLPMQALVLCGVGDVYRKEGKLAQAAEWYECAAVPAAEAGNPVVLRMVTQNLADLATTNQQHATAEKLYEGVVQLATHQLDVEGKVAALEQRGLAQEAQGAFDRAVKSWEEAAGLCRNVGQHELRRRNLTHLERVYRRLGVQERLAVVRAELRQVKAQLEVSS